MTQSNKIAQIVADIANSTTAVNLDSVRKIPVYIQPSEGFKVYTKVLIKEQARIFEKDVRFDAFDGEKLCKYLISALKWRVAETNQIDGDVDTKTPRWMSKAKYDYPLPAFFFVLLAKIGVATSRRYALKFVPNASEELEEFEFISREDFEEVRAQMKELRNRGLAISKALPRGDKGDFDFMALNWTEEEAKDGEPIRGFTKARPDYAFYRSLIYNKELPYELIYQYVMKYDDEDEYMSKYRVYSDRIVSRLMKDSDLEITVPKPSITEADEYKEILEPVTVEEEAAEDITYKAFDR